MWERTRKFFEALCNWLAPWLRYIYFLRFSLCSGGFRWC